MDGRLKELNKALKHIGNIDCQDLGKLVSSPPPSNPVGLQEEKSSSQRPFTLEAKNKDYPHLLIYRDLELDKDINPIYSFRFVYKGTNPETKEVYLGSFGSEEVLETLANLNRIERVKPKARDPEMDGFEL